MRVFGASLADFRDFCRRELRTSARLRQKTQRFPYYERETARLP